MQAGGSQHAYDNPFSVRAVLEILATAGVPSPPRFNLMAGGLAFYFAALLFGNLHLMH